MAYGEFGNSGALAMMLSVAFFSIPSFAGLMRSICFVLPASCILFPTITFSSPLIFSFIMSEALTPKVHSFLILIPLENVLTH